jgi:hypothetical protein
MPRICAIAAAVAAASWLTWGVAEPATSAAAGTMPLTNAVLAIAAVAKDRLRRANERDMGTTASLAGQQDHSVTS